MTQTNTPRFSLYFEMVAGSGDLEVTLIRDLPAGICGPWGSTTIPAVEVPEDLGDALRAALARIHADGEYTFAEEDVHVEDGSGTVELTHTPTVWTPHVPAARAL